MILATLHGHVKNYTAILVMLAVSWVLSKAALPLIESMGAGQGEHGGILLIFFDLIVIFTIGYIAYELAKPTVIPSFVLAIFFGFIARDTLTLITHNPTLLSAITTLGASLILFGGGLETPFTRFRELLGPILSLAFVGTVLTAVLFSGLLMWLAPSYGISLPVGAAILLGAAISSTDPAAIIPSFKVLLFRHPRVKYISVSESAINDVVGAVLTGVFLGLLTSGAGAPSSIIEAYSSLLTAEHAKELFRILGIGCAVGVVGFGALQWWSKWKERAASEGEADAALFLAIPIFCFTAATLFGGSGFLAVFVSSLMFHIKSHVAHVEHYFNHTVEAFMKPAIFMLLGAMVHLEDLLGVAPLGVLMGLLFMFVIRPAVVFISLGAFTRGTHNMTLSELCFLSFVRETGVIPAVLLVSIGLAGIDGGQTIIAVGLWIILLTLVVQPPLTPFVARWLGIARETPPFPARKKSGPIAVLCSRRYTFLDRLDHVVDWALKHATENVAVLHCAENKYSPEYVEEIQKVADMRFQAINEKIVDEGRKPLNFEFVARPGLLQENIESFVQHEHDISIIFVGEKMLDYRLQDVKRLRLPFVFLP